MVGGSTIPSMVICPATVMDPLASSVPPSSIDIWAESSSDRVPVITLPKSSTTAEPDSRRLLTVSWPPGRLSAVSAPAMSTVAESVTTRLPAVTCPGAAMVRTPFPCTVKVGTSTDPSTVIVPSKVMDPPASTVTDPPASTRSVPPTGTEKAAVTAMSSMPPLVTSQMAASVVTVLSAPARKVPAMRSFLAGPP